MVLTVSFVLSPGTGLSCPRSPVKVAFHRLDTSVGASGPHDFAVRLARRSSARRQSVHRIPHPTSVTIAIRPSCGTGWRGLVQMICPTAKAKYFLREDWTAQISLNCLTKIAFWRMGFRDLKSAPARRHEATSRSPDQQPTIFHVCVRGPGGIKTPARCPGVKRRSCAGSAPATW